MTSPIATVTHPDRATVARMLAALAEVFGQELTETRVEGYLAALADVPTAHLRLGMQQAMRACTFFPKPAELRRAVDSGLLAHEQSHRWERRVVEDLDPRVSSFCLDCEDHGLVFSKDRNGRIDCVPVSKVMGSGWYVRPCPCRGTNPAIKRRYERQAPRYARESV
jgi:hypothetical protein